MQDFAIQTSLSVARDRIVGILLGLLMMWLVFDQLWGVPAAIDMKRTFISNLRGLAQLARDALPWNTYPVRERINANFEKVRSLADGILFETGSPSRQQDLALRNQIRRWQPQFRMLSVKQVALLKYRLQLAGFELPMPIVAAQREFDSNLALVLETMAEWMEGRSSAAVPSFNNCFEGPKRKLETCWREEPQPTLAAQLPSLISLDRGIESLMISLAEAVCT